MRRRAAPCTFAMLPGREAVLVPLAPRCASQAIRGAAGMRVYSAGGHNCWTATELARLDSTRIESNQLNSTQLESFAMKETMACLLGAPHGNQRCSDKVLRGRKRWRVLPWASQRLRGEKPLETRRCCFDRFSWSGALAGRRQVASAGGMGDPAGSKEAMGIRRLRKGSRVTSYRRKSCVAECKASCRAYGNK